MTEKKDKSNDLDDVTLFEKMISHTEELVSSGRKTLEESFKRASDDFASAGEFTREQSDKISDYVKKDLQHAVAAASKTRDNLKETIDPKRVAVGVQSLFSKILTNTAGTVGEWAKKTEQQLEYKTGEVTSPGTLTCKKCSELIHMKKTARIPPCPKCHHILYRKSY